LVKFVQGEQVMEVKKNVTTMWLLFWTLVIVICFLRKSICSVFSYNGGRILTYLGTIDIASLYLWTSKEVLTRLYSRLKIRLPKWVEDFSPLHLMTEKSSSQKSVLRDTLFLRC
jgi:hypothetical protein